MSEGRPGWTDEQVDRALGNLLRVGVVTAAAVVLVGGVIFLVRHGTEPAFPDGADRPNLGKFTGEPAELCSPVGILGAAGRLRGRGLIQLGLLLLIATPVARVGFSALAFLRQRDWVYVAVTLFVLAVLLFSLFGGYWQGGGPAAVNRGSLDHDKRSG
jgi:uncharacterized membrane protein